jgi:TolB-like protein
VRLSLAHRRRNLRQRLPTCDAPNDLSRLRNVLVISRNTAATYKDKHVEAKQIGRELGVRYVLEGSVRRSGNLARISGVELTGLTHPIQG